MCASKELQEAQNPLIIPSHRLIEAFAKSDEEREFYIDRQEGFVIFVDLDKPQNELEVLEEELHAHPDRYCPIPKLSFYETKKIMEGFVNEKVYDIDTKEKLLDIIQSKEARENFIEFIFDHHLEQEKWQQYYQEKAKIRIIEWLRANHFHFVFEEDLDLPRNMIEQLKHALFQTKVSKEILAARKVLVARAKIYYSSEALNPRPKRGRPPKQAVKQEVEHHVTVDVYTTVPPAARPFLFTPEHTANIPFTAFSSKFSTEEDPFGGRLATGNIEQASLNQKMSALRSLSSHWLAKENGSENGSPYDISDKEEDDWDDEEEDEDDFDMEEDEDERPASKKAKGKPPVKAAAKPASKAKAPPKKAPPKPAPKKAAPKATAKKPAPPAKSKPKRITPQGKAKPKKK